MSHEDGVTRGHNEGLDNSNVVDEDNDDVVVR
jgi:hypothetical protein